MEGVAPQFVKKLLLKCRAQAFRRGRRLNVITGLEGNSIQMTYAKGGTLKLFPFIQSLTLLDKAPPRCGKLLKGPPALGPFLMDRPQDGKGPRKGGPLTLRTPGSRMGQGVVLGGLPQLNVAS